jgi:D-alanyl-D-alanine carboxypeptidase
VDAGTPRPIASLTKLMTALVVVDRLDLDEDVTIPASVNDLPADASRMDARAGERWKASDLLKATLVYSANDAALALATAVGKGSEADFVELMNERAEELGLSDTHFTSATGLDDTVASSTSTPVDLASLAVAALAREPIRTDVAIEELELVRPNGQPLDPLHNRNPLLGTYDGVDGGKTGFTDAAGYMLFVHHVDDETGGELVVVTFASTSERTRVSDSRALLDWARPLRQDLVLVEGGEPIGSIPVQRSDEHLAVFACDDAVVSARVGQRLVQEVVLPKSIARPIRAGDEVGTLRIHAATTDVHESEDSTEAPADTNDLTDVTVALCAGEDVAEPGRWERVTSRAREWRSAFTTGIDEVRGTWTDLT